MARALTLLSISATLLAPGALLADACLDEVRAVYEAELDAYARPPHRLEQHVYDADGALVRVLDSVVETPLDTLSGVRGSFMALVRGSTVWTGPGPDGPWTKSPQPLPADREADHRRMHAEEVANISDAECLGTVTLDGREVIGYSYSTVTDKDPDGVYFGGRYTAYLDPATGLPVRIDSTDMVSSWAPEPSTEVHVTTFAYDDSIALPMPE